MSAVLSDSDSQHIFDPQVANLRIPPHSLEAEASVLGGLLLEKTALDREGDLPHENAFYRYEHGQVFAHLY